MSNYKQLEIPFDFEEFRDIEGYEGLYQVSSYGRVYSLINKRFLKSQKIKTGYLQVDLWKNRKRKKYYVHRLVAQAFLENQLNLSDVNHINEVKTDNRLCNLEWMSHKENINYGTRTEKRSKKVLQMTKNGEFVAEFPSTMEASRQTRINQGDISRCCNGNNNYSHAGGYVWRFKDVS